MLPVSSTLLGAAVIMVGLLCLYLGLRMASTSEDARRLEAFVSQPIATTTLDDDPLSFRRAELQGTLRERLLLPAFQGVGRILGRLTPTRSMARLSRQIEMAGRPLGLGPREFYGLQLLFIVLSFWLAFTLLRGSPAAPAPVNVRGGALAAPAPAPAPLTLNRILVVGIVIIMGTQYPRIWLRGRVRRRQRAIRRNLPDALDMLSVCAEAGLGFDQGVQRVSERWKTPLGIELGRLVSEMGMGLSRQQALRNLADRLDVTELSSFVAVIIQSDQMGMSIADTLRAQAEQMRIERRHRAQEEARKAPLKMLFPLLFLILPAIGAVVVGPVLPALADVFDALR